MEKGKIKRYVVQSSTMGNLVIKRISREKARHFIHPNPKSYMLELNRMWIDDCLGKNAETILISRSLRLLKEDSPNCVAVQSFADGRLGCGTIYKASNFKYFGSHRTTFFRNKRTGEINHAMNLTRMDSKSIYMRNNMAYLLGDLEVFEVDTYRYIFPLCKRFRYNKKEQKYPEYQKGIHQSNWNKDKNIIKTRLKKFIDEL